MPKQTGIKRGACTRKAGKVVGRRVGIKRRIRASASGRVEIGDRGVGRGSRYPNRPGTSWGEGRRVKKGGGTSARADQAQAGGQGGWVNRGFHTPPAGRQGVGANWACKMGTAAMRKEQQQGIVKHSEHSG